MRNPVNEAQDTKTGLVVPGTYFPRTRPIPRH